MTIKSQGEVNVLHQEIVYRTPSVILLRLSTNKKCKLVFIGTLTFSLVKVSNERLISYNPTVVSLEEFKGKEFFALQCNRHGIDIVLIDWKGL